MTQEVRLIFEPTVIPLAHMQLIPGGLNSLLEWVQEYRPECVPDELPIDRTQRGFALFPHDGREETEARPAALDGTRELTDNELLVELAGRNCYHSYGLKAGKKTNHEYIAHTQSGSIPHASIMYHAKMTFFLAGISRRVSHELIRHYVGADRSEEGSPSQESTRYTEHPGFFAVHPRVLSRTGEDAHAYGGGVEDFREQMEIAYGGYLEYISTERAMFRLQHEREPAGMDRKRIYEAAAGLLPMQACTSMFWTTNPVALAKLFKERCDDAADLEFQRFAKKWRDVAYSMWPNLFPAR